MPNLIEYRAAHFDHQHEAISAATRVLIDANRCQIIMACGTGKTRVGPALALEMVARTVIVYVPSLALVRQTLPAWINAPFDGGLRYLCVCSDKSVGENEDTAVVLVDELIDEFHAPRNSVTSSAEDVRAFLSGEAAGVRVVFSTYQSADVVSEGCPAGFAFDLGLFDEAHRTAGKEGSAFSHPLRDDHTPITKRVFMTATPKHVSFRKKNKAGEGQVKFSMCNEAMYGPVAYRLPVREAINRKIIADYRVLVSVVDDKQIAESLKDNNFTDSIRKNASMEQMALAISLRDAMNRYGVKKMITFHSCVAEAQSFAHQPQVQQEMSASMFHVNGKIPTRKRGEIMDAFAAAPIAVATNARCLTEGVDVPEIDLVAFPHPRKSHVDIIQAIGRALRLPRDSDKSTGYVLLPLYVSQIENGGLEAALMKTGYDTIFQVVQALREQDEVIDAEIRDASIGRQKNKATGETAALKFLTVMGAPMHVDFMRQVITTQCIEQLGESWDTYYGVLKRIGEDGGDANVSGSTVIDGLNVGNWLERQRGLKKAGKLTLDKLRLLEDIGIIWTPLEHQWLKNCGLLARLKEKGQNVNVPLDTIIDENRIGIWFDKQRQLKKAGKLSPDKIKVLEDIGVIWEPFEHKWLENYDQLVHRKANGQDVNMPSRWLSKQRQLKTAGKLSPDKVKLLEDIGVILEPYKHQWLTFYGQLAQLKEEGMDANISSEFVIDGRRVGSWLWTQKRLYKAGELPLDKVKLLEDIGVRWSK